jgi:hypothetical protein
MPSLEKYSPRLQELVSDGSTGEGGPSSEGSKGGGGALLRLVGVEGVGGDRIGKNAGGLGEDLGLGVAVDGAEDGEDKLGGAGGEEESLVLLLVVIGGTVDAAVEGGVLADPAVGVVGCCIGVLVQYIPQGNPLFRARARTGSLSKEHIPSIVTDLASTFSSISRRQLPSVAKLGQPWA